MSITSMRPRNRRWSRHITGERRQHSAGQVLFLGDSRPMRHAFSVAEQQGLTPADDPHRGMLCAVVDEELLDGLCTPQEAHLLQRVRAIGIPCLTPAEASSYFSSGRVSPGLASLG